MNADTKIAALAIALMIAVVAYVLWRHGEDRDACQAAGGRYVHVRYDYMPDGNGGLTPIPVYECKK